jgi:hypothetical protein
MRLTAQPIFPGRFLVPIAVVALGFAQAITESRQQLDSDLWVLAQNAAEIPDREKQSRDIFDSGNGGRAWQIVQQSHFAQHLTYAKGAQILLRSIGMNLLSDLDFAFGDHEQSSSCHALLHKYRAVCKISLLAAIANKM